MTRRVQLALLITLAVLAVVAATLLRGSGAASTEAVEPARASAASVDSAPASALSGDPTTRVERARAAELPAPPSVEAAAERGASIRSLRVLVVRSDTRRAVADCDVQLVEPIRYPSTSAEPRFDSTLRTDASGAVEFTPPAGRELCLDVGDNLKTTTGSAAEGIGSVFLSLSALSDFEQRTLTIELPIGLDRVFCGRAVTDEDRTPIEGARVLLFDGIANKTQGVLADETDGEGFFEVRCASWRHVEFALEAPGCSTVRGGVPGGRETRARALEIPLTRAARLEVQVLVNGVAPAGSVNVVLTTPRYAIAPPNETSTLEDNPWPDEDPRWSATCDARGACAFEGLPPRVTLSAVVLRAGETEWKPEEPLNLLPGETRVVTWDVAAGARLTVRVLDLEGKPVANRTLWLTRDVLAGPPQPGQCYFYKGDEDDVIASRKTDGDGVCVFDAVASGAWWVGPGQVEWEFSRATDDVCALGTFVEIAPGGSPPQLELRLPRGAKIAGRVVDPDGNAVDEAPITATHTSIAGRIHGDCRNAAGEFTLGPVASGSHALVADSWTEGLLASEPVTALPGGEPVVLRLRRGARLAGTVFDGTTNTPVKASVLFEQIGSSGWSQGTSDERGAFTHTAEPGGRYHLTATTDDGRIGTLSNVELRAEAPRDGLRIEVGPGAWLTVEYRGPADHGYVELRSGGALVGDDGIPRGGRKRMLVQPGDVDVSLITYGGVGIARKDTQTIRVAAGETRAVVVGGP